MNEAQWLVATDPTPMLEFLRTTGRASEPRLRLAACACVRRGAWGVLPDERPRAAVDARERFEDGHAAEIELREAQLEAWRALVDAVDAHSLVVGAVRSAAEAVGQPYPSPMMRIRVAEDRDQWWADADRMWSHETETWAVRVLDLAARWTPAVWEDERAEQCGVLRCVFGNPFRARPAVALSVLRWQGGTVALLAQTAYEYRVLPCGTLDADRLAVLADALEDAGSDDVDLMGHLREQGAVHVRGCWALDAILGRKYVLSHLLPD